MHDVEDEIRRRARQLWQQDGCPPRPVEDYCERARELVAIEANLEQTLKPLAQTTRATIEPIEAVENSGEFPTLTDQGEERAYPRRRKPSLSGSLRGR